MECIDTCMSNTTRGYVNKKLYMPLVRIREHSNPQVRVLQYPSALISKSAPSTLELEATGCLRCLIHGSDTPILELRLRLFVRQQETQRRALNSRHTCKVRCTSIVEGGNKVGKRYRDASRSQSK